MVDQQKRNLVELIKHEIGLLDVIRRFGGAPKRSGSSYKMKCPFHTERTASFNIHDKKNLYKCFGCDESGDQIKFVRMMLGGSRNWYETLNWFIDNYNLDHEQYFTDGTDSGGMPIVQKSKEERQSEWVLTSDRRAKILRQSESESVEYIDQIYRFLLDNLEIEETETEDLQKRGCSDDWAYKNYYRSLPVNRETRMDLAHAVAEEFNLKELHEDHLPEGFFYIKGGKHHGEFIFGGDKQGLRILQMEKWSTGEWNRSTKTNGLFLPVYGMLVPHRNRFGKILTLKVRNQNFPGEQMLSLLRVRENDRPTTSSGVPKYTVDYRASRLNPDTREMFYAYEEKWVSKYMYVTNHAEDKLPMTSVHYGNYEEQAPVYQRTKISHYWYVTEGEIKADIISKNLGVPVLGLPGVTANHFDLFWELNAFDHFDKDPEEMREILDKALIKWEELDDERQLWLTYKRGAYRARVEAEIAHLKLASQKKYQDERKMKEEIERRIILAPLDAADQESVITHFPTTCSTTAVAPFLYIALDEDDGIAVAKGLHRLAWMCLALGITPMRVRWDSKDGKGFDDLTQANGKWRVERMAVMI